jgi:sec-independent protein translocase protein TatA
VLVFGSLGLPELIIIFALVLLIFGTSRVASLGKGLGEGIRNFKQALKGEEPPDNKS